MSWHLGLMCAFDLETTGVDPLNARVVTACVARVDGSGRHEPAARSWLIDPGVEIPEAATAVHGITTEQARAEGMLPPEALDRIASELQAAWLAGAPVIGHNVAYDLTVLACELERHGLGSLEIGGPVIDTLVLDKQVDRFRKGKRTLTRCCEVYGVRLDGAHDSTFDALAAARIAWRIAQQHPQLQGAAAELHELQVGWAAEQAASLQTYFRKADPAAVVDGTWPVRSREQGVAA